MAVGLERPEGEGSVFWPTSRTVGSRMGHQACGIGITANGDTLRRTAKMNCQDYHAAGRAMVVPATRWSEATNRRPWRSELKWQPSEETRRPMKRRARGKVPILRWRRPEAGCLRRRKQGMWPFLPPSINAPNQSTGRGLIQATW